MQLLTITGRGSSRNAVSSKDKECCRVRLTALCGPSRLLPIVLACAAQLGGSMPVRADVVPQTMNGVPLLPIPTFDEVGLPPFTMPTGTPTVADPSTPTPPTDTGGGGSGDGSDSVAMATMMSRSWGAAADANAQSLGVNGATLAATCMIESGCQNLGGTGTINGAFQMSNATYTATMAAALQRNPSLAANIVPGLAGKLDPATQSIAAAEYERQGAEYLQAHDMQNPSFLDVRGFYNFGPGNALSVAQASNNALMSDQIRGLTTEQIKANGIDPATTTVGQWRASIINKVGSSVTNAFILIGNT